MHTNKNAEDFKILKCSNDKINDWKDFVPAKSGTLIGGLTFKKMDNSIRNIKCSF